MLKNPNITSEQEVPRIEPKPFILKDSSKLLQGGEKKKEFVLEPTPIMQLKHVHGYTGGFKNLIVYD